MPTDAGAASSKIAIPPAYSQLNADELRSRLKRREAANSFRMRELEELELALEHMESRVGSFAAATPVLELETTSLQATHAKNSTKVQELEARVTDLRDRLSETQMLLDEREAEVYETEEAVRTFENRERARLREIASANAQVRAVEAGMRSRQRELLRLERTRDGEATAVWWKSLHSSPGNEWSQGPLSKSHAARKPRPRPAPGFASLDNDKDDGDVAALKLREERARASASGGALEKEETDFAQFHSLALGIKLALAGNAGLRNVGVQELWEEAKRERLPRTAWQPFLRRRLFVAPKRKSGGWLG